MKWTIMRGATRRQAIAEVLSERHGTTLDFKVRGNCVWSIKQADTRASIVLFQLRRRGGFGWGYRRVLESQPPLFHSCPLRFLDQATEVCPQWRQNVRAHHGRLSKVEEGVASHPQGERVSVQLALLRRMARRTRAVIQGVTEVFNAQFHPDSQADSTWAKTHRALLIELFTDLNELEHCICGGAPATRIVACHGSFAIDLRGVPLETLPLPLAHVVRVDLADWRVTGPDELPSEIPLTEIGYWYECEGVQAYAPILAPHTPILADGDLSRIH